MSTMMMKLMNKLNILKELINLKKLNKLITKFLLNKQILCNKFKEQIEIEILIDNSYYKIKKKNKTYNKINKTIKIYLKANIMELKNKKKK